MDKEKINFKYLKKNFKLTKLIELLDKIEHKFIGDDILDKIIKSCPDFDKEDKDISFIGYTIYIDSKIGDDGVSYPELTSVCDLSIRGRLLHEISSNFKLPEDSTFIQNEYFFNEGSVMYNCIYSKINKTFYLQACECDGFTYKQAIIYKSENKDDVFDKIKKLGNLTKSEKISSKENMLKPEFMKALN